MKMCKVLLQVVAFWVFTGTNDFVLFLHSGIISRDINLFKKHFYYYITAIPGVTVQHMGLIAVENLALNP